ncbi:MAG: hypothetical protein WA954_12580 [Parerythrobacter sp.]
MKFLLPVLAAVAFAAPAMAQDEPGTPTEGELELAKLIEGREAGEPQRCVFNLRTANLRVIDGTALVYERGSQLYVNIPRNARSIDDSDIIVTRPQGNRLCRTDLVTTRDRFNNFYTGNIFLEDFVPYRRVDD